VQVAKTVLTAGLLVATAGVAQAAVQMTYNGQTSYEDVTVTSPVTTVNNTNSIRTRAGALKMGNETESFGLDSEFVAFCLDLSAFITTANYDKTGTPFLGGVDLSSNPGGLARRQYMQNLFDNVYGTFDKNNSVQSAALQVALWEIAYENGTVGSVSTSGGGGFRITSTGGQSANVIAQANTLWTSSD
jgi:hypothetical protein